MSTQPVHDDPQPQVTPLDPNSDRGRRASAGFAAVMAGVHARLLRQGIPIPGQHTTRP